MRFPPALAAVGVAVGAPLLFSACVVQVESSDYTTRDEKRFAVSGTPEVTLATFDGAVEVRAWDRPEVVVEIEKAGSVKEIVDAIAVVSEQEGNRIRVEAREPANREWHVGMFHNASPRVRLVASVPRNCNVLAHSGDGSVEAERLRGRVELRTGDGSVRGIDLEGELHVETSDGSVKLQDVNGAIEASSGNGSIFASGRLGLVSVRTNDGTVSVSAAAGSEMSGAWDISTGDGNVVLSVPEKFGARIDASTGDGIVRLDPALGASGTGSARSEEDRRALRARLGDGTHVIRIHTGDGSIRIRKN
jgi:hypothetical protein